MNAPPTTPSVAADNRRATLILVAAMLALMTGAALALFSTFMFYDDEGYILVSLRNFAEHGGLYREVYSQYGPLPYVLHYALWLAGYPLTHIGGRIVTLVFWAAAAFLCAQLVWRASRQLALALATLCAAVLYLWMMIREPNHPGGLATVLLALAGYGGFRALESGRTAALAALGGGLVAALLLTKINLGVFAACSVVALLALHGAAASVRRFAPWIFAVAGVLLPLALMRTLIAQPWVQIYAVTFAVMAVTFMLVGGIAAGQAGAVRFGRREIGAAMVGGFAVALPVIGVVVARGTSLADILEGTLLGPLRHPAVFSAVLTWPSGVFASIALGGASAVAAYAMRGGSHRGAVDRAVAVGRLLLAGGVLMASLEIYGLAQRGFVFCWCGPWLWLCLWPLPREVSSGHLSGRTWLGLLLLGQWLHAYPVPGSQVGWGSFLSLPLIAIAAPGAVAHLAAGIRAPQALAAGRKLAIAGLVVFSGTIGLIVAQLGSVYWISRPLGLPGMEQVRIPDATTSAYRILAFNATAHADMLFTFPGMCSFNLWTGLPSPTLANTTHWFSLLDEARQRRIIQALEAHPRAALIVQTQHIGYLQEKGFAPKGILYEYLRENFARVFRVDDFEFHLRRGRAAAPFFTAELLQRAEGAAEPGTPAAALRIPLALPAGTVIDRIEIARMDDRTAPPALFDAARTRVEVASINGAGAHQGAPAPTRFPLKLAGPSLLSLYFDTLPAPLTLRHTLLVLRAPDGAEIALVRLRP